MSQTMGILREMIFRDKEHNEIIPLDGPLRPNDVLDHCQEICTALEKPDDVAMDEAGNFYISTGRRVIRLSDECPEAQAVFAEFDGLAGGLRFHPNGCLMVCVGERGLVLVNEAGVRTWIEKVEEQPIRCPTSAVAGADGKIYIADGTTRHNPEDWVWDLMEKNAAGRLIRYNPDTGKSEILLSRLRYPYGLEITHDGRSLLLTESWNHRLLSYPIDDIRPVTGKAVIRNMPGYPARIIQSKDGGYWICLFAMRTKLLDFVLTEDKYRKEMIRRIKPSYWVRPYLSPSRDFLDTVQAGHAKTLGVIKPWAPPRSYGLVIKLDKNYSAVNSFHSRVDGSHHGITGLCEHNSELYAVSKGCGAIIKVN